MTPAQELLEVLVKTSEGTRKDGFTTGGATVTVNQAQDVITATVTIPVTIATNVTGDMVISAKDFLNFPA